MAQAQGTSGEKSLVETLGTGGTGYTGSNDLQTDTHRMFHSQCFTNIEIPFPRLLSCRLQYPKIFNIIQFYLHGTPRSPGIRVSKLLGLSPPVSQ